MLNNIKACIFDMDGTIIDSMGIWRSIDEEFLGKRNITLPGNLQKEIEGMNFSQTAAYFKDTFNLMESIEEIMDIWHDMAYDKYCSTVSLKEGVLELLEYLKHHNILMGIATSNSKKLATGCLKALEIHDFFDIIITGDDVKKGKPDPECYNLCAGYFKIEPSQCLVFEDIMAGIYAAKNAGMKVCAVYDKYSENTTQTKKDTADFYIDCFRHILEDK